MFRTFMVLLLTGLSARAGEFETRYSARLAELDEGRPESACEARDMLRGLLPQASPVERAGMFRRFLGFNGAVALKSGDAFGEAMLPIYDRASELLKSKHWRRGSASSYLRGDPQVRNAIGPWLDCGFGIYRSEGSFYLGPDIATAETFAPMLPPDLRAWIKFLKREGGFDDVVEDDDAVLLSWTELGDRLHR